MSGRARDALESAEVIVGYGPYVDLIRPLVSGREIVSTGMTKEVDRVTAAIEAARAGRTVALISSGDPGIYAMAGLALEICVARKFTVAPLRAAAGKAHGDEKTLFIEVVPGIPALCAGAALLGAPLMHDFAAISLSDLLTPWEVIEKRLHAAAGADFVIVIYNPKSKKRDWQLNKAQKIILNYRGPETPVGIVTSAMRPDQRIAVTTLELLHHAEVNMQTTVFIGNAASGCYGDFLYTRRGYEGKYAL